MNRRVSLMSGFILAATLSPAAFAENAISYLSCTTKAGASLQCEKTTLDDIMSMAATAAMSGNQSKAILFQCDQSQGKAQCQRMAVDLEGLPSAAAEPNQANNGGLIVAGEQKLPPVQIKIEEPAKPSEETPPKKAPPALGAPKAGNHANEPKPNRITVKSGENLSSIVHDFYGETKNTNDVMAAVFLANPQAFANNDLVSLRAGSVLNMPDLSSVKEGLWSKVKAVKSPQKYSHTTEQPKEPLSQKTPPGIEPGDVIQSVATPAANQPPLIVGGEAESKSKGTAQSERQKLLEQVMQIQGQINSLQKALPEHDAQQNSK